MQPEEKDGLVSIEKPEDAEDSRIKGYYYIKNQPPSSKHQKHKTNFNRSQEQVESQNQSQQQSV